MELLSSLSVTVSNGWASARIDSECVRHEQAVLGRVPSLHGRRLNPDISGRLALDTVLKVKLATGEITSISPPQ
jgi:hypothetical protein